MGHRELRRVPLDFDAPLNKVWAGFINPYYQYRSECEACEGSGENPETKRISDLFYSFDDRSKRWCNDIIQDEVQALVDAGRLMDFTHEIVEGKGWVKRDPPVVPTCTQVNQWNQSGMGHDACNRWILCKARATRLGVFGLCEVCGGEGEKWPGKYVKSLYDEWKETPPPTGDGYQLWETTSEGSPKSPVFESMEGLAAWCELNATIFGAEKTTRERWLAMFKQDTCGSGSLLVASGGIVSSAVNHPAFNDDVGSRPGGSPSEAQATQKNPPKNSREAENI